MKRDAVTNGIMPCSLSALLVLIALVLTLVAAPKTSLAQGPTPTFSPVVSNSTNSSFNFPGASAVGDFNGDGKLDVLVTDGSSDIRLLLGNGDGTFTEHDISVPGANPGMIMAADLNGDGTLDAVFTNNGGNQDVTVLMNTGNDGNGVPQFAVTNYSPGFGQVRSVAIGDLNGDGRPDFIVGGAYADLRVFLNNGDGTFTATGSVFYISPSTGNPSVGQGAIADLNGDGKADFIVTSIQGSATDIFFGNGDGTFQNPVVLPGNPVSIAVADLNKDGRPDFVEGTSDGNLAVYLNNGDGTFAAPTFSSTGGPQPPYYVDSVAIADVNGDGNLDVVAGNYFNYGSDLWGNTAVVFTGNGDGTFGAANLYSVDYGPLNVQVADFNGDGKPDIGTVCYQSRSYDVLLNTTITVPPLVFKSLTASPSIL